MSLLSIFGFILLLSLLYNIVQLIVKDIKEKKYVELTVHLIISLMFVLFVGIGIFKVSDMWKIGFLG